MKQAFASIEGWMELGDLDEADLEFQSLPRRALATQQGLWLWLRLSRKLGRWPEVQAAASQLQAASPRATLPTLHEAEALHHQGHTTQAVMLLASRAADFAGEKWSDYLIQLKAYVALADLSPAQMAMFQAILDDSTKNGLSQPVSGKAELLAN